MASLRAPPDPAVSTPRWRALTMPAVTEPSSPSELPTASTVSPTSRASLSPRVAAFSPETPWALTTARSVAGSVPTTLAATVLPSLSWTVMRPPPAASSTTWLLVTMRRSEVRITPDPSTCPPAVCTVIDTTVGVTAAATLARKLPPVAWVLAGVATTVVAGWSSSPAAAYPPATPDPSPRAAIAATVTNLRRQPCLPLAPTPPAGPPGDREGPAPDRAGRWAAPPPAVAGRAP